MVRARVQVRGDAAGDRRRVAVHRERVDQRVTAAVGEVSVRPAQPAQVAEVVGQAEIRVLHPRAADGAGPLRVGLQDQLLLRGEQRPVAEDLPGLTRVLRRDEVGVRTPGPLRREPQNPGAEGRQDPAPDRDLEVIELVQVADERGVGALILPGGFGVPDPEAEQEAARVPGGDPVVGGAHGRGIVLPHVDDPGGHGDVLRGVQQMLHDGQVTRRGAAHPDGSVPEGFHFGHDLRGEPRGVPPDTDLAQFDAHATDSPPGRSFIPSSGDLGRGILGPA